ncbi:hypothetical protein KAT51_08280 [bacterium]|nr:hypothetical protein [bacterium]
METFEIKSGKHKGELGVVVGANKDGIRKTLTLEGDIHYYNQQGCEVVAVIGKPRPLIPVWPPEVEKAIKKWSQI